jgi:hypothetical protein
MKLQGWRGRLLLPLAVLAPMACAGAALAAPHCVTVDARKGWQKFKIPLANWIVSISGAWTVDAAKLASVGAEGHLGAAAQKLAPFAQHKYLKDAPFGAPLITQLDEILVARALRRLPGEAAKVGRMRGANEVYLRINDGDQALGDNAGALTVCFDLKL